MKKIFIDTNVLLDLLLKREPHYACTALVFDWAVKHKNNGVALLISSQSIINAHYILKKQIKEEILRAALNNICVTCEIIDLNKDILVKSFSSPFGDFEDATQHVCALTADSDVILTNNERDFRNAIIPVMNADEFWAVLSTITIKDA
ncbi:twitching motility protein PilT [Bacteroidia bacterium]|nr:twitching motility protein PilT [Bacteroidia bacterium]